VKLRVLERDQSTFDPNRNVYEMTSLSYQNLEGLISTPLKSEEISRLFRKNKLMNYDSVPTDCTANEGTIYLFKKGIVNKDSVPTDCTAY
jgi:hypothetical protein